MPIDPAQVYLKLYVGMTETYEEYLYLDLKIPTREIPLWESKESLENCSGEDLLKYIGDALNESSLYTKNLGIRLKIEMGLITELFDDFSDKDKRNIHELLKEIKNVTETN